MNSLPYEDEYFRTSDISLCSTICLYGYHIDHIEKQQSGKAIFLIQKDSRLDELIKAYFAHELKVEPISFFGALREIKTRIYNIWK